MKKSLNRTSILGSQFSGINQTRFNNLLLAFGAVGLAWNFSARGQTVTYAGPVAPPASGIYDGSEISVPGDSPSTEGTIFTANTSLWVTELGIWTPPNNSGLRTAHDVGLWTVGGTLLGSVSIPAGNSAQLINQYYYETLETPVQLTANTQNNAWSAKSS
jgi:hypothetical protein